MQCIVGLYYKSHSIDSLIYFRLCKVNWQYRAITAYITFLRFHSSRFPLFLLFCKIVRTRDLSGHYHSPEYNEYFHYKLYFLAYQKPGLPFRMTRKTQNCQRRLIPCFLSSFLEFCSAVSEGSRKCLSKSETTAAILFSERPKNTNLVEDVEILLPVKFR